MRSRKFVTYLHNYALTVWPRTTKIGILSSNWSLWPGGCSCMGWIQEARVVPMSTCIRHVRWANHSFRWWLRIPQGQ